MRVAPRRFLGRMNKFIVVAAVVVGGFAIAVPALLGQTANADSTVTVTPSSHALWSNDDTRTGGAVSYVADSSATGNGALLLTTDATTTSKAQYTTQDKGFTPVPLSAVTSLSYSTKQNSADFPGGNASYQLIVYVNGTSGYDTFTYEPYLNSSTSAIHQGVWQSWDVDSGRFYSSRPYSGVGGSVITSQGDETYTLTQLKTLFPNAVVISLGINIGTGNPSYNVEADNFNFNGTTYNFDLDPLANPQNLVMMDGTNYATINPGVVPYGHNPVQAQLSWDAVAGATGYSVQVYKDGVLVGGSSFGWNGSWVGLDGNNYGKGDGVYTFIACASNATQQSCSPESAEYIIDTTAPKVALTTPVNGGAVGGSVTITGTDTELHPSVNYITVTNNTTHVTTELMNDNTGIQNPSVVWNTTGLTEGSYTIRYEAKDKAGNETAVDSITSSTFTVDNSAPSKPVLTAPTPVGNAFETSGAFLLDWANATDALSSVKYYEYQAANDNVMVNGELQNVIYKTIDHQGPLTQSQVDASGTADGVYYWQVRAVDNAGNKGAWSDLGKVTVDTAAPVAPTLVTASPYIANGASKTLTWNASTSSDVDHYEYAEYNNAAPTSDTTTPGWTKDVTGTTTTDSAWQSDITIYWRVRAVDQAGNVSPWSETRQIITDRTAPVVTIATNTQADATATITGTVDDTNATLVATFNGINYPVTNTNGAWTFTSPTLTDDTTYSFSLAAKDIAANTGTVQQPVVTPPAPITPVIVTPAADTAAVTPAQAGAQAAAAATPATTNNGVLGDATTTPSTTDTTTDTTTPSTSDVKGDSTVNKAADAATTKASTLFGLPWYISALILAAVAAIIWWIVAAARRSNDTEY